MSIFLSFSFIAYPTFSFAAECKNCTDSCYDLIHSFFGPTETEESIFFKDRFIEEVSSNEAVTAIAEFSVKITRNIGCTYTEKTVSHDIANLMQESGIEYNKQYGDIALKILSETCKKFPLNN